MHPASGVYPWSSLPLAVTYQKEGRATELPDSITGLLIPAYDGFWTSPNTFVPHHLLLTARPHLIQAPGLLTEAQFLRHEPTVFPSLLAEN